MDALFLKAHAKINFYLEVGERFDSGYHQVTTILQSLSLADVIAITPADEVVLECDDPLLAGEHNLVMSAARILLNRFKPNVGARLNLFKKIPVAAGLGGGSADAAAVLVGLNKFWDLGLSDKQLEELGPELGADVNFCLTGGTALATGFGEKIKPLPPVDIGPFLLAKPKGKLSSGSVYAEFDLLNTKTSSEVEPMIRVLGAGDSSGMAQVCANDLETAAISLMPEIAVIKERALSAGAVACVVSGSGPSVFAIPSADGELSKIAEALDDLAETWIEVCENHGTEIMTDENEIKMATL